MTQILIGTFDADRAFVDRRANRASNSALSPAVTECFDIVVLPGASEVTSQVDWLSSNDTNTVATPSFVAVGFHAGTSRHRVGHRYSPSSTNDDGLSVSIEPSSRP